MSFAQFLRDNDALREENFVQPQLGEWVKRYLEAYPLEQQERDILESMARERWYDAEQVLEELEAHKAE